MPLKHHTETAYLIVLGIAICLAGIFLSLLPDMPMGLMYWGIGFLIALLYPFVLRRTFRANRADYEFRLLHLFPAGMFAVWMVMQVSSPYLKIAEILKLGFFYLWSMPLVFLGLFFIGVFAAHVLRRKSQRIFAMLLIAGLFFATGSAAESLRINPELSRAIFPREDGNPALNASDVYRITKKRIGYIWQRERRGIMNAGGIGADLLAWWSSSDASSSSSMTQLSSSSARTSSATSSLSSSRRSIPSVVTIKPPIAMLSSSSSSASLDTKPTHLVESGPEEGVAVLALTLLALYAGTLHQRARRRA